MSRSKWKGPYIDLYLVKKIKKHSIPIISRASSITPKFIGLTFKVHNGKKFLDVTVLKDMVGCKFGEFVLTRSKFTFKKKKKA